MVTVRLCMLETQWIITKECSERKVQRTCTNMQPQLAAQKPVNAKRRKLNAYFAFVLFLHSVLQFDPVLCTTSLIFQDENFPLLSGSAGSDSSPQASNQMCIVTRNEMQPNLGEHLPSVIQGKVKLPDYPWERKLRELSTERQHCVGPALMLSKNKIIIRPLRPLHTP